MAEATWAISEKYSGRLKVSLARWMRASKSTTVSLGASRSDCVSFVAAMSSAMLTPPRSKESRFWFWGRSP